MCELAGRRGQAPCRRDRAAGRRPAARGRLRSGPGPAMCAMGGWPADGREVIAPAPSAAAVPCAARHAAMPALAAPGTAARLAPACRIAVPGRAGWRDMSSRVSPPFWVMDSVSWTGAGTGLPVPVIISVASRQGSPGAGSAWLGLARGERDGEDRRERGQRAVDRAGHRRLRPLQEERPLITLAVRACRRDAHARLVPWSS